MQLAAERADHDFARVQADPDQQRKSPGSADLLGVFPDQLLHLERGIAGPHGMILISDGSAEQRLDPVSHHLVDRAFVTSDGFHHPFKNRIEQRAGFFGVEIGDILRRSLQVGTEHGHLLALAFLGRLGCEDAFGQVTWRVQVTWRAKVTWRVKERRGGEDGCGGFRRNDGSSRAATVAILASLFQIVAAARAGDRERHPALAAKFCLVAIILLTSWTLHAWTLRGESNGGVAAQGLHTKFAQRY